MKNLKHLDISNHKIWEDKNINPKMVINIPYTNSALVGLSLVAFIILITPKAIIKAPKILNIVVIILPGINNNTIPNTNNIIEDTKLTFFIH